MIDFHTLTTHAYTEEYDDKLLVHPLFFSAYKYVEKQLKKAFPEDERLQDMDREKPVYSRYLQVSPLEDTINTSSLVSRATSDYIPEEQVVSPLLFELLDILPFTYRYVFYQLSDDWSYPPQFYMEYIIGGEGLGKTLKIADDLAQFPMEESYQRDLNVNPMNLNIDYTYFYLPLGNLMEEGAPGYALSSVDDYLNQVKALTHNLKEKLDDVTLSHDFVRGRFSRLSNEVRLSFQRDIRKKHYDMKASCEFYTNIGDRYPWQVTNSMMGFPKTSFIMRYDREFDTVPYLDYMLGEEREVVDFDAVIQDNRDQLKLTDAFEEKMRRKVSILGRYLGFMRRPLLRALNTFILEEEVLSAP